MALTNGFIKNEAQTLVNLCMQLNGTGTEEPIPQPPEGWKKIFDGHNINAKEEEKEASFKLKGQKQDGLGPFDNAWEFWRKEGSNQYAVVVRGTVDNIGSIMDDVLATTLKSDGFLEVGPQNKRLPLRFAPVEDGAVHLGFTWGAAILTFHKEKGILRQLLNIPDNSEIYITGHSQGAAIATLLHAVLYYAGQVGTDTPFGVAMRAKQLRFKSYVFAQPKPANWQFCQDFAQIAGNQGRAICINNSRDWVPQVPFAFGLIDDITGNPIPAFLESKGFLGKMALSVLRFIAQTLRGVRKMIGDAVSDSAKRSQKYLFEHMDTAYLSNQSGGDNASASINYNQCGQLISLQGHVEPQEKTDGFWQHHLAVYQRLINEQLPNSLT